MRRPGNLGGTNYWFGSLEGKGPSKNFINSKLQEIALANKHNHTKLNNSQTMARLKAHMADPRAAMRTK